MAPGSGRRSQLRSSEDLELIKPLAGLFFPSFDGKIGEINDMRFEDPLIGKLHAKNLHNPARFGRLMVCGKNANFQDFRP